MDTSLNTFSSQYSGNNDKPARVSSEKLIPDIRKCLELQVGKTGEINTEYGGFEITVNEPGYFPWYDVFATLLKTLPNVGNKFFRRDTCRFIV
ncbi:MAG: hypothetical protein QXR32_05805, partial [Candidatus Caldarchaeum sp.]